MAKYPTCPGVPNATGCVDKCCKGSPNSSDAMQCANCCYYKTFPWDGPNQISTSLALSCDMKF